MAPQLRDVYIIPPRVRCDEGPLVLLSYAHQVCTSYYSMAR